MTYRVTIYRDDSVTPVVYDRVKHTWWSSGNTVFTLAVYREDWSEHDYIIWPREQIAWAKIEREVAR